MPPKFSLEENLSTAGSGCGQNSQQSLKTRTQFLSGVSLAYSHFPFLNQQYFSNSAPYESAQNHPAKRQVAMFGILRPFFFTSSKPNLKPRPRPDNWRFSHRSNRCRFLGFLEFDTKHLCWLQRYCRPAWLIWWSQRQKQKMEKRWKKQTTENIFRQTVRETLQKSWSCWYFRATRALIGLSGCNKNQWIHHTPVTYLSHHPFFNQVTWSP